MGTDEVLVALFAGAGAAVVQWVLSRSDRIQQRERMALEIKQLSDAVRDTADSVRHRLPGGNEYEFYRGDDASAADDFIGDPDPSGQYGGAAGEWQYAQGVLQVKRLNMIGETRVRLNRYRHETASAPVIQGRMDRTMTTLRVSCEARVIDGDHTILFVLKSPGDNSGVHLAPDQRARIHEEEFRYVEKWFTYPAQKDAYLRIVARSPERVGGAVELRRIVVSDRPPEK